MNAVVAHSDDKDILYVSLKDAISKVLEKSPELQAEQKKIGLSELDIDTARANYHPSLSLTGQVSHQQKRNDLDKKWGGTTPKSANLSVKQPLYRGGQTVAEIEKQKVLKSFSEYNYQHAFQQKTLDTVKLYITTYWAAQGITVNGNNISLLEKQLASTQARFEAGELTKTDVAQAEAQLSQAKAEKRNFNASFDIALSTFRRETGILNTVELLYPNINLEKIPSTLDSALSIGLRNNPQMMKAIASFETQKHDIDIKKGAFLPQINLDAGLGAQYDSGVSGSYDDQKTAEIGISATIPLYQGGALKTDLERSKLTKNKLLDDLEVTRQNISDDIVTAWENYKSIRFQLDARKAQLEASKLAYQGVVLEEEVGARSVLDVLEANQDVKNAELFLIETQRDFVTAYYTLFYAMGVLETSLWDKS